MISSAATTKPRWYRPPETEVEGKYQATLKDARSQLRPVRIHPPASKLPQPITATSRSRIVELSGMVEVPDYSQRLNDVRNVGRVAQAEFSTTSNPRILPRSALPTRNVSRYPRLNGSHSPEAVQKPTPSSLSHFQRLPVLDDTQPTGNSHRTPGKHAVGISHEYQRNQDSRYPQLPHVLNNADHLRNQRNVHPQTLSRRRALTKNNRTPILNSRRDTQICSTSSSQLPKDTLSEIPSSDSSSPEMTLQWQPDPSTSSSRPSNPSLPGEDEENTRSESKVTEIDPAEKVWQSLEMKMGRKLRDSKRERGRWVLVCTPKVEQSPKIPSVESIVPIALRGPVGDGLVGEAEGRKVGMNEILGFPVAVPTGIATPRGKKHRRRAKLEDLPPMDPVESCTPPPPIAPIVPHCASRLANGDIPTEDYKPAGIPSLDVHIEPISTNQPPDTPDSIFSLSAYLDDNDETETPSPDVYPDAKNNNIPILLPAIKSPEPPVIFDMTLPLIPGPCQKVGKTPANTPFLQSGTLKRHSRVTKRKDTSLCISISGSRGGSILVDHGYLGGGGMLVRDESLRSAVSRCRKHEDAVQGLGSSARRGEGGRVEGKGSMEEERWGMDEQVVDTLRALARNTGSPSMVGFGGEDEDEESQEQEDSESDNQHESKSHEEVDYWNDGEPPVDLDLPEIKVEVDVDDDDDISMDEKDQNGRNDQSSVEDPLMVDLETAFRELEASISPAVPVTWHQSSNRAKESQRSPMVSFSSHLITGIVDPPADGDSSDTDNYDPTAITPRFTDRLYGSPESIGYEARPPPKTLILPSALKPSQPPAPVLPISTTETGGLGLGIPLRNDSIYGLPSMSKPRLLPPRPIADNHYHYQNHRKTIRPISPESTIELDLDDLPFSTKTHVSRSPVEPKIPEIISISPDKNNPRKGGFGWKGLPYITAAITARSPRLEMIISPECKSPRKEELSREDLSGERELDEQVLQIKDLDTGTTISVGLEKLHEEVDRLVTPRDKWWGKLWKR